MMATMIATATMAPSPITTTRPPRGLSPGTLAACDAVAFLPQMGRVGSLNVATAASIAIYELRRQSWV